jgi:hypothetical protein
LEETFDAGVRKVYATIKVRKIHLTGNNPA